MKNNVQKKEKMKSNLLSTCNTKAVSLKNDLLKLHLINNNHKLKSQNKQRQGCFLEGKQPFGY